MLTGLVCLCVGMGLQLLANKLVGEKKKKKKKRSGSDGSGSSEESGNEMEVEEEGGWQDGVKRPMTEFEKLQVRGLEDSRSTHITYSMNSDTKDELFV